MHEGSSPLAGVRVLDLTRLLPGGFCTRLLADLGADVVKLEDLRGGDYLRWISGDVLFPALNRGKRSLALDLQNAVGRATFLRLLPGFDVLVESFRPGVMARLGCGYEESRTCHPGLIYCAMSGYGQAGKLARRSGHDINYMAIAGLLSGFDVPFSAPVADFCGGYAAALAIVAALESRRQTGRGCFLDISLSGAVLPLALTRLAGDRLEGGVACYHVYRTADGKQFSLGALEPKFFAAFARAVGRPELAEAQFDAARQKELKSALEAIFSGRTRQQWEEFFARVDACGAPVLTPQEVLPDREVTAFHPSTPRAGVPGTPGVAPSQGQHSAEILAEAGFSAEEIAEVRAARAISGEPS